MTDYCSARPVRSDHTNKCLRNSGSTTKGRPHDAIARRTPFASIIVTAHRDNNSERRQRQARAR